MRELKCACSRRVADGERSLPGSARLRTTAIDGPLATLAVRLGLVSSVACPGAKAGGSGPARRTDVLRHLPDIATVRTIAAWPDAVEDVRHAGNLESVGCLQQGHHRPADEDLAGD
jgi:hypothetical protein